MVAKDTRTRRTSIASCTRDGPLASAVPPGYRASLGAFLYVAIRGDDPSSARPNPEFDYESPQPRGPSHPRPLRPPPLRVAQCDGPGAVPSSCSVSRSRKAWRSPCPLGCYGAATGHSLLGMGLVLPWSPRRAFFRASKKSALERRTYCLRMPRTATRVTHDPDPSSPRSWVVWSAQGPR